MSEWISASRRKHVDALTLTLPSLTRITAGLKAIRRHAAPVLFYSGVAVLGYAAFQYGTMLLEQRHLLALWRAQQRTSSTARQRDPVAVHETGLTRISIPSIDLSAIVVEGTDLLSLLMGPGHLSGTSLPGDPGNSVISAHRDTFFRNITDLVPGDHILVEREGRAFTYEVEGFRVVKPTDISVVAPTDDNRLTLVTCDPAYYPGPAPQRLVVISKLLPAAPAPVTNAPGMNQPHVHIENATIQNAGPHSKAQ
jgi:LPXTG-site transpeptidase (sortase) family protein